MNYATINAISHFCTRSYKGNWPLSIMTSYRSKPFAVAKKRPRKKAALNSPVTPFLFYKNSFCKNREAENRPKIKNFVKITPDSRSQDL